MTVLSPLISPLFPPLSRSLSGASRQLALKALLPGESANTLVGVLKGIGDVTVARSTERLSETATPGLYYTVAANEMAVSEDVWLSHVPAATNVQIRSNDFADVEWTATNVAVGDQDEVGVTGVVASACTLTATAANGTVIANAIIEASGEHGTLWHIKRKTGTGTIELTLDNGTTWQDITSQLDTAFIGIAVSQAALANPQIGIRIVTDTDAVIVGNAGAYMQKVAAEVRGLPPIITSAAPVSIETDGCSLLLDNHSNNEVCYFFEWSPGYNHDEITIQQRILASGNSGFILLDLSTAGAVGTNDGTSLTNVAGVTYTAGSTMKVGVMASISSNLFQMSIDGALSAAKTYDGYTLSTALDLFRVCTLSGRMKNLQRWNIVGYAGQKAKIDELMA